jgi:hypothetical protein
MIIIIKDFDETTFFIYQHSNVFENKNEEDDAWV